MNTNIDPLAHASAVPDIAALITECELAQNNGPCSPGNIGAAEDVQYQRRSGKSNPPDGKRWQKNQAQGSTVRPYDGCPDSDCNIADELVMAEVDIKMMALEMAQLGARSTHISKLTAAQVAELKQVAEWCRAVTREDMRDDGELLAQMDTKLGWSVLNPGWCEKRGLVERELDMESFINGVMEQFGPDAACSLYASILDPTLEDAAVEVIGKLFAHVPAGRLPKIVRELREDGTTMFVDVQVSEKRPTLRTLIQGYNYFNSGAAGRIGKARLHLVIERFSQADLENTAASNDWNKGFVKRVIATAGQFSALGEAMQNKILTQEQGQADKSIEIWTTTIYQFDEDTGAAGYYCTTFSPHVLPAHGGSADDDYAKHYLLGYACGAPFVQTRRMVEGPGMDDSRGVPEMVRSDSAIVKMLTDAFLARAHLEVDPPRAFLGMSGTKITEWNKPGAKIESMMPGGDVKDLSPTRGSPQVGEMAIERVTDGTRRRFAMPNNTDGSHPSAWQMRQMRIVKRFMGALEDAFSQLVILCYQEFEPDELAQIIGHWPQLTLDEVMKHRITLTFDVRGIDPDWRSDLIGTVHELLGMDRGGIIDTNKAVSLLGSVFDPGLIAEITTDEAGASAKLYRKVSNDIADIMLGNPPPLVEMDATAGMQMKMAMQIIGQNEDYQRILQQDQKRQENFKTYMKNLQHSEQETSISPQQGRLGVAAQPQRPVQKGATQLAE